MFLGHLEQRETEGQREDDQWKHRTVYRGLERIRRNERHEPLCRRLDRGCI